MASQDRLGWLTTACEYIEFSFSSNELGRYDCPLGITEGMYLSGFGLSTDNRVVIGGKRGTFAPMELSRATRTWNPVPISPDVARGGGYVAGFDGTVLVALGGRGLLRFVWAETPAGSSR